MNRTAETFFEGLLAVNVAIFSDEEPYFFSVLRPKSKSLFLVIIIASRELSLILIFLSIIFIIKHIYAIIKIIVSRRIVTNGFNSRKSILS